MYDGSKTSLSLCNTVFVFLTIAVLEGVAFCYCFGEDLDNVV